MRSAKEDILARIRNAQKLSHTPAKVEVPREYDRSAGVSGDELIALFIENVEDYRAEVRECTTADLPRVLADVLRERNCHTVTYAPGLDQGLFSLVDARCQPDSVASDPRELGEVDAVVTDSHVSCAQTGTITLEAGELSGRRALTLVPDRHVCLVREDSIVHRIPEMMARINSDHPSTMISGPSATSDIELDRVEGVHGPRDLIVIVVRG